MAAVPNYLCMAMKVLITGATGLVGKRLVSLCRDNGIAVHYLTTSKNKIVQESDYKGFYWNPSTGEIDENAFEGVDTIIHLAGATIAQKWTTASKQVIKDSRIKSAQLMYGVLERFRKSGNLTINHIISASAIGCYPSSETKYYDENYEGYAQGFLGEVVQEWEEAVLKFEDLGITTSLLRTGIILDENEGALAKIAQPIKMYAGAPLGAGQQWQSWIHIEDMARLYLYVLQNRLEGIYNAVAPNPVTNEKLTREVASILKKPLFLPKVPAFALKMLLGDMSTIVLESQKVSADRILQASFAFKFPNLHPALEDLFA